MIKKAIKKVASLENKDKNYLLLVIMGIAALCITFLTIIYYLRVEMNLLRSGQISAPEVTYEEEAIPSPEIFISPESEINP